MDNTLYKKYEQFMKDYEKSYDSIDEMVKRFDVFKKNYMASKLEVEKMQSTEQVSYGTTQFMDLTPEEFEKQYLTLNVGELPTESDTYYKQDNQNTEDFLKPRNLEEIPESWDWREHGAVSAVRQQGSCGSCWAFTTVSNVESQYFLKTGKLLSLSEQQLIDCDYTNSACAGGIIDNAYRFIRANGGLMPAAQYPYEGFKNYCRFNANAAAVTVTGYQFAGTQDEEIIKEMLYKKGPLAITVNARTLQYYQGGVIDLPYAYCPYAPNHGVNLVGYGVTAGGLKYWIIRNTWGPTWGEGGYYRIARGRGLCGVNGYVATALVA
jgi:cathepsin F